MHTPPSAPIRAHPRLHTVLRQCPPHAGTHTQSFPKCVPLPPHMRTPLHAHTHTPVPPALREHRDTYWVPRCEAGRSVLPRAPNGICIHGSPQPRARARGRGCGVPFPKLGAGARSAAAPGGAWAPGAAPPARPARLRWDFGGSESSDVRQGLWVQGAAHRCWGRGARRAF